MNARHTTSGRKAGGGARFYPKIGGLPDIPAVAWQAIGASAPQPCAIPPATPPGQLPAADVVVITWAESEWAALEHVFIQSGVPMPYGAAATGSWDGWIKYDANMPDHSAAPDWTYWGYYRLVTINNKTVLLFKSNTHLDWPGASTLSALIGQLCDAVKPALIMSIGTAGGSRLCDHLGTVNVVNAATMYQADAQPSTWPNYACDFAPNWSLVEKAGFDALLFAIPASEATLQTLADQFNAFYKTDYPLATLNADNLVTPDPLPAFNNLTLTKVPLLTAATFVVGTTSGGYEDFAVIEMDDAVIAQTCLLKNTQFAFVRNVSDTAQNAALPLQAQADWGSAVYEVFGFYTSYNGVLATWAIIEGMD